MTSPEFIIVGRVRKAHGIRGEVVVETITDEPDAIFASGRRVFAGTAAGDLAPARTELHIATSRPFNEGLLVGFKELPDRNVAETWRGRYLLLPANELPAPDDDEIYVHDLLGMRVIVAREGQPGSTVGAREGQPGSTVGAREGQPDGTIGEPLGTVIEIYELPQGLALDVRRDPPREKETVLLNYDDRTVASVDKAARVIIVTPPEGLLE